MRVWLIASAGVLLLATTAVLFWHYRGSVQPADTPARQPRAVQPAQQTAPPTRAALEATGYITARREATVSARIAGQVKAVLVEEGDKVKRGQLLARLNSDQLAAQYRLQQAQLAAARSKLLALGVEARQARLNLQRVTTLEQHAEASKADLDNARFALEEVQAKTTAARKDIAVAKRQLTLQAVQLEATNIRAPFAGIVTDKAAQPGEIISPYTGGAGFSRTGICTIVDMHSLEIDVDVDESNIHRVFPGQRASATLDAYPNWQIPARVITIIPTADRSKGTVRVRVRLLAQDPRILPDMAVKVAFNPHRRKDAPQPPSEDKHHG